MREPKMENLSSSLSKYFSFRSKTTYYFGTFPHRFKNLKKTQKGEIGENF